MRRRHATSRTASSLCVLVFLDPSSCLSKKLTNTCRKFKGREALGRNRSFIIQAAGVLDWKNIEKLNYANCLRKTLFVQLS